MWCDVGTRPAVSAVTYFGHGRPCHYILPYQFVLALQLPTDADDIAFFSSYFPVYLLS